MQANRITIIGIIEGNYDKQFLKNEEVLKHIIIELPS